MQLAAVVYETGRGVEIDNLMRDVALTLLTKGVRLAGVIQGNNPRSDRSRCDMIFQDLASGTRISGSQDRGALAKGCRLDTNALEAAAGLAVSALDQDIELVIINRFGKREAEGHGFRSVIEQAIVREIPVVVGVSAMHLDSWRAFTGGEGAILTPAREDILTWCYQVARTFAPEHYWLHGRESSSAS